MKSLILLLVLLFSNCIPAPKTRAMESEQIIKQREICEENGEDLFESLFYEKSKETIQTRSGQVTSVVATSTTALTETLVYLGGGAVVGILVCSPILAVEASSKSKTGQGASCVLEVGSKVTAGLAAEGGYKYTRKVWDETSYLRDFDFDELSGLVRANCECYMKTRQKKDVETAFKQIREWKRDHGIWEHLSRSEKNQVEKLEKQIDALLSKS